MLLQFRSVMDMNNWLSVLSVVGQLSVVMFGVMIVVALAMASLSIYYRNRGQEDASQESNLGNPGHLHGSF